MCIGQVLNLSHDALAVILEKVRTMQVEEMIAVTTGMAFYCQTGKHACHIFWQIISSR